MRQMLQVILMCQWRQKLYCQQQQLAAQPQKNLRYMCCRNIGYIRKGHSGALT